MNSPYVTTAIAALMGPQLSAETLRAILPPPVPAEVMDWILRPVAVVRSMAEGHEAVRRFAPG